MGMQKTKILFAIGSMGLGGAERSLLNLLSELPPEKYDIDLLVMQKKGALLEMLPDHVHLLDPPRDMQFLESGDAKKLIRTFSPKAFLYRVKILADKRRNLDSTNYRYRQKKWKLCSGPCLKPFPKTYDTAVAFMHSDPAYFVIDKVNATKKYLWIHNDYSVLGADTGFDKPYFTKADRVVTISQECTDILKKTFPEISDRFMWLDNISSKTAIGQMAMPYMPEEYTEAIRILSVGRMTRQKGFDLALDAAAELKRRGIRFRWYFLGEGELYEFLKQRAEKLQLGDAVCFLGVRSNPYPYIKNAHIIAQTSRFEGKSRVLDEAKMLCRPILATRYQTVGDQIEDGITGVLCDMDGMSIANSIEEMIVDEQLCKTLESNLSQRRSETADLVLRYRQLFEAS